MDKNHKISDKSQKVVTYFGYWWVTFSVIFGVIQLSQWAFNYVISIWWVGLILFAIVFAISTGISFLLLKLFPNILDKIFNKLPENKKYYDISKDEELTALKAIIYSNLSNLENDETLLLPLKMLCEGNVSNDELLQSIRVGLINSPLFHRLGKTSARVLNGIYTLFALNKAVSKQLIKINSAKYCYVKNYVLINDLGWSLAKLTDSEYNELKDLINNTSVLQEFLSKSTYLALGKSQKQTAIENIEKAKKELSETHSHEKLIAQAIRHLLNIEENYYTENNLIELDKVISKIKNDNDKLEMQGNACFLRAVHKISELSLNVSPIENEKKFNIALEYINSAQVYFESMNPVDKERLTKCFNVKGKLYLKYSEFVKSNENLIRKAIEEFKNGLDNSRDILRYDQVLRNLLSLAEIYGNKNSKTFNLDESAKYAKEGIRIAETLNNNEFKLRFLKYYKPKHIILIRHGESQKNIDKVVNGEGHLTDFGKRTIEARATIIRKYLEKYGYKKISIYGHDKFQVRDTINILKSILKVPDDKCKFDDTLKPTDMGILKGVKESNEDLKEYLLILEKWRNRTISVEELTKKLNSESVDDYWLRAKSFVDSIDGDECSIVVCTTSIAILLTHYLTSPQYSSERYVHIDVPLGGIIHFAESIDRNKFEIINKESLTNINFVNVE